MKTTLLALCLALSASTVYAEDAPAAAKPTEAKPAEVKPAEVAPSGVSLTRFEIATGVEEREPVGAAAEFAAGTKLYAFLDVKNPSDATELVVTFEREGGTKSPGVTLSVPSGKRYRTYAHFSGAKAAGTYKCTVTTGDGTVVAEKTFQISG
jgi:hypothetical protein